MWSLYLGLLILGSSSVAEEWNVSLNSTTLKINMGNTESVPITVLRVSGNIAKPNLTIVNPHEEVATVELISHEASADVWNYTISITGVFLGRTTVEVNIDEKNWGKLEIAVIHPNRPIDHAFTGSVILLVSILFFNFGCAIDWDACREAAKKPIGAIIGSISQFVIMPLLAYGIGLAVFPDNPDMQLGLFFTGISPSGGASNIWTILLGGNLSLSVGMTTLSTLASFATIPFWVFTLGKVIFQKANFAVPYRNIGYIAVGLIIPLIIGFIVQRKVPRVSRLMVRIMKPFSIILILIIVIFAIVTNSYLLKLLSWRIVLAGLGLPWLGFIAGFVMMLVFRQPQADIRAISIETGIRNTGVAILLLRLSMQQPEADITTVIPVADAIMTPIPLAILWIIKMISDRRKKLKNASNEKLQGDNIPVVISNYSTATP